MPAPDLGPAVPFQSIERPLAAHLLPSLAAPAQLAGSIVIVIDALRASVTISAALSSGASRVIPTLTVEDAIATKQRMTDSGYNAADIVLGGERGGVLIPGFDLDNSPLAYTSDRVRSRSVIFTTANGTAAMLHAASATRVLIGALTNLSQVVRAIANDPRPVHIICSGTRGEITFDDCLAAGAIVDRLLLAGRQLVSDDSALVCLHAWKQAQATGIEQMFSASRGGRNLLRLGFQRDLSYCATVDALPVLPEYFPARGELVLASE